jgi:hypothetical protein
MEPESWLLCSQELATGDNHKPDASNPYIFIFTSSVSTHNNPYTLELKFHIPYTSFPGPVDVHITTTTTTTTTTTITTIQASYIC